MNYIEIELKFESKNNFLCQVFHSSKEKLFTFVSFLHLPQSNTESQESNKIKANGIQYFRTTVAPKAHNAVDLSPKIERQESFYIKHSKTIKANFL